MPLLFNIVYLALVLVLWPWFLYQALTKGKYRQGLAEKLWGRVPRRRGDRPCVWFHAVSVGEVNLVAPLLAELQRARPELECVLSTTTRTGMELARRKYPRLTCFYAPLDFSWAVRAAMRRVRPELLVLVELELWPNLIRAASEAGARVAVINGRLGERSHRGYRRIRPLVRRMLAGLDLVAAQDHSAAARFIDLGLPAERVTVTGSVKYDGARTDRANPETRRLAHLAGFASDDLVFLAGSTQAPEEQLALDVFRDLSERWPKLRLVIVPRHPERFGSVARLLDESDIPWRRRTDLDAASDPPGVGAGKSPSRVLLVDVVGELGGWWGTAAIAFVGGSMHTGRGGQNMIEPAGYGAAVCFGPDTRNFRDIVATMLARRAAVVVHDAEELRAFVERCLDDAPFAADLGHRAQELVRGQQGAAERTVERLLPLLPPAAIPLRKVA